MRGNSVLPMTMPRMIASGSALKPTDCSAGNRANPIAPRPIAAANSRPGARMRQIEVDEAPGVVVIGSGAKRKRGLSPNPRP